MELKQKDMKTFKDLRFAQRFSGLLRAELTFENGYGVSVVTGDYIHGYEIAVMKDGDVCYDTPIIKDVINGLDDYGVTDIMQKVQTIGCGNRDTDASQANKTINK